MTNKEALNLIQHKLDLAVDDALIMTDKEYEVFSLCAKALEQAPCEDTISRQVVKERMIKYGFHAPDMTVTEFVEDLPPVTPQYTNAEIQKIQELEQAEIKKAYELGKAEQPKVGHWIMTSDYLTTAYGSIDYVKCSCCGEDSLEEGDYCPNCGSKMGSD